MIPGRKANPQQEFDEQWVAGGGSMRENPGERKMLCDILDAGETIKRILRGTFRQDTDRLHRHRGVVVATSKRVIFADKGVYGSSEVMVISYESIESVTYSTGMFRAGIQIKGKGASSYRIEDIGSKEAVPLFVANVQAHIEALANAPTPPPAAAAPSLADELERLAALMDRGHPHRRRVRSKEGTATRRRTAGETSAWPGSRGMSVGDGRRQPSVKWGGVFAGVLLLLVVLVVLWIIGSIAGEPRKSNRREDYRPGPRGRGTDKLPIIGAVERGGKVVAKPSLKVDAATLTSFLNDKIDADASLLITDNYTGYTTMRHHMRHVTVDHSKQYVDGLTHTNTIEGFWSLLKRAWYGSHHHYTKKHSVAYVVEACYKYNARSQPNVFEGFLQGAVV